MSNELNEKIFRSVDTIVSARLQNLPFDQTIVGVIESVPESVEGAQKYIVNYKGAKLTVFVNEKDKSYALNEEVYVLIPQGNFSGKKLITGRVISDYEVIGKDDSKTFYAANQLFNQNKEITVIPTSEGRESSKTIMGPQSYELVGYTTLRISYNLMADLYNGTKTLNKGIYGIRIILSGKDQKTKELKTFTRQTTTIASNKDMLFLSAYKTGGYTSQYFDIDITNLIINNIQVEVWEDGNFYDSDNNKIDSSDSFSVVFKNVNLYLGYYKSDFSDIATDSNIGVYLYPTGSIIYQITSSQSEESCKVEMGFRVIDMTSGNLATFTNAKVQLYSYDKNLTEKQTIFGQGWYRLGAKSDGTYDQITISSKNTISAILKAGDQIGTQSYRIQFKGKIGTADVLGYSQVCSYTNKSFNPDIGLLAGLSLFANDNNNTFYIYGQDNQLLARSDGEKIHYIGVTFNSKDTSKFTTLTKGVKLRYTLPSKGTMLIPVESGTINNTNNNYEFEHILKTDKTDKNISTYDYLDEESKTYYIPFKINSLYNPLFRNNTITCEIEINNQIYTNSIELLFGNSGSSGANCVLQLSLQKKIGDKYQDCKVIYPIKGAQYQIVAKLYDYTWQEIINNVKLTYSWYYNSLGTNKITLDNNNIITIKEELDSSDIDLLSKLIIKVQGIYNNNNLEGYLSIPTTFNSEYVCANGCSIVTYDITGKKPVYEKTNYQIFKSVKQNGLESVSNDNLTWSLGNNIENRWKLENNVIIPPTVFSFSNDNSIHLYVQAQDKTTSQIVWIQPIIAIKNNYPIAMWNDLQGADINFNNKTLQLMSTTVGQLNSEQDMGVLMGTFKNDKNLEEYGLYAFDKKNSIFKINDQGEAWIKTATSAQNLASADYQSLLNVGSSGNPVYFLNGVPVQCNLSSNSTIKTLIDRCDKLEQRIQILESNFNTLQQTTIPNLVKRIQALENK